MTATGPSPVFDATLHHPFTCVVSGPPRSGKSVFTYQLIVNADRMIYPPPKKIVWFYGQRTQMIDQLSVLPNVTTVNGLPQDEEEFIEVYKHSLGLPTLFVIDDLQSEASVDTKIAKLFSRQSHHESISVVLILQDLFHAGKERKSMLRASHYIVLFNNPLDFGVIHHLARRILPNNPKTLVKIAETIFQRSAHSYIMIDGSQTTPFEARFRTDIFNIVQRVFIPR